MFDLIPNNRKSFYGKAQVDIEDGGAMVLYSYGTSIVRKYPDGTIKRIYRKELTNTTARHLIAFCGLHTSDFRNLDYDENKGDQID